MKKRILLLFSLVAILTVCIFAFSSCGGGEKCTFTVNTGLNHIGDPMLEVHYMQEGDPTPEVEIPTKEGYRFIGWDKEIPEVLPAGELTVNAVWELLDTPEEAFVFKNGEIERLAPDYLDILGLKIPAEIGGVPVTKIGLSAFMSKNFIDVIIPEGVTVIRKDAFAYTSVYNEFKIPDTVTTIEESAFRGSDASTIPLPKNLKSIGRWAFEGCENLKSVCIPAKVKEIGAGAFRNCRALLEFTVAEGNTAYKAIDGDLYNLAGTVLIQYAIGKTDTLYEAPSTVTEVTDYAFQGTRNLKKVHFSSLNTVSAKAFFDCYALEEIKVSGLESDIYQTDTDGILYKVVDNERLVLICWPKAKRGPVTVKSGVKEIAEFAFYNCKDLGVITLPISVDTIASHAFSGCDNLSGLSFDGTMDKFEAIEKGEFWNSTVPATYVNCSDGHYNIKP